MLIAPLEMGADILRMLRDTTGVPRMPLRERPVLVCIVSVRCYVLCLIMSLCERMWLVTAQESVQESGLRAFVHCAQ